MLHLKAFDAENLARGDLFDMPTGKWQPSGQGPGAFLVPLIVNGKVYVAADKELTVYHLPPAIHPAPAP
jgi:hypothetical protein